jgi:hypothetical protein
MTLDREFVLLYLAELLQPTLADQHFMWLEHKNQFRRDLEAGFQNFILSVSPYDDLVIVDAHFGLRHDGIEDLVGPFTRSLTGWRPDAHTLIISYGKLIGDPYRRFKARDTDQLDRLATTLLNTWTTQALPLLETNQELEQIDHLLNDRPEEPTPYLHNQTHRCLRGIAAAWLTQRPGFERLAETYRLFLQRQATNPAAPAVLQYQKLLAHLRERG